MKHVHCATPECVEHVPGQIRTYRPSRAIEDCPKCGLSFCGYCIDDHYDEDGYKCGPEQYDGQLIEGLVRAVEKAEKSA